MVDVVWNNRTASCHFITYELRRDDFGSIGTESLTGMLTHIGQFMLFLSFTNGNVFHFRGDNTLARIMHLGNVLACFGTARFIDVGEADIGGLDVTRTLVTIVA